MNPCRPQSLAKPEGSSGTYARIPCVPRTHPMAAGSPRHARTHGVPPQRQRMGGGPAAELAAVLERSCPRPSGGRVHRGSTGDHAVRDRLQFTRGDGARGRPAPLRPPITTNRRHVALALLDRPPPPASSVPVPFSGGVACAINFEQGVHAVPWQLAPAIAGTTSGW